MIEMRYRRIGKVPQCVHSERRTKVQDPHPSNQS
jgi:hypothetical protein